jgi:two-component system OmpR family sensor kinase
VKRRLFWKILISSWLTLILFAIGNAIVFGAASTATIPWGIESVQRFERLQLATAAGLLQSLGPEGVKVFIANLPQGEHLQVTEGDRPTSPAAGSVELSQVVHTPSGTYTLTYRSSGRLLFAPLPPALQRIPLHLLLVDLMAVSIFSIFTAWWMAGPIQKLRAGLARIAEGDLSVRVADHIGRRRDELADMARDFDLMAERLQRSLASREQLLHYVSHEFKTPLTRLLLAVELARQNPDRSLASLERIEYEAQRLSDLIGELLSLSRLHFSAANSDTWFAIIELVATVVADARFEAEAKQVSVISEMPSLSGDSAGPILNGSPELLRKGIENVLRNAVKISKPGQSVSVRLIAPPASGGALRIEISDEGPGVPEADLERIFEPFVRLEGQPQGSGFGLGLAIARSAARAHHGSIAASNRAGGGLRMTFDLPVQPGSEQAGAIG